MAPVHGPDLVRSLPRAPAALLAARERDRLYIYTVYPGVHSCTSKRESSVPTLGTRVHYLRFERECFLKTTLHPR